MTPETAPAAEGAQIGHCIDERYRLEAVIGVGGLGTVYRATHTKLQRQVAVKLMHESLGDSQVNRGRFAREAKALAALQHPNIVAVLDYGVADSQPYLVMELLEGETLSQRLHRGPLPVERALHITQQLLEALSFMHRAKLVHRDVKPSNVFLQRTRDGKERVKVLDFGLAKFTMPGTVGDPTLTRDGAIVGTPAYMSPEQATGEIVDARADVYAAGVILFRMLSGRLPFEGDAIDQVRSHLISPVPDLRREAEPDHELDPALEALIRRAMAKRREDRFDDAGRMLRALAHAFPQHVHAVLPAHEVVLPDPFAVDALNAAWLLENDPSDNSQLDTLVRLPRAPLTRVARLRRAMRTVVVTGVRLFAGVSVLLVLGTVAIFALLFRDEADRAELSALRQRFSDRLIERSTGGVASTEEAAHKPPESSQTTHSASRQPPAAVVPPPEAPKPPPATAKPEKPKATLAADPTPARPPISSSFTAAPPGMLPGSAPAPRPSAATPPGVLPGSGSAAAAAYASAVSSALPIPLAKSSGLAGALAVDAPLEHAKLSDENADRFTYGGAAGSAAATLPVALPPAEDPWLQPLPERLRRARKTALSGARGSEAMIEALREYNRETGNDPRGHLLLGQLYLNRFWRTDALSQFSIAISLDPSARGAPEVLSGLVLLVIHGGVAREADRVIVNRFGSEALPQIDRALDSVRDKDPQAAARLEALRTRAATAQRGR